MKLTPASLRVVLICFSTVVLLLSRQLSGWTDESNRFLYFWQRSDALAFAAAILLATGVAALIAHPRQAARRPDARAGR